MRVMNKVNIAWMNEERKKERHTGSRGSNNGTSSGHICSACGVDSFFINQNNKTLKIHNKLQKYLFPPFLFLFFYDTQRSKGGFVGDGRLTRNDNKGSSICSCDCSIIIQNKTSHCQSCSQGDLNIYNQCQIN